MSHTFTFLCGDAVLQLPGPGATPYPTACFDVSATLYDISTGGTTGVQLASCAGALATVVGESVSCGGTPLCAAGSLPGQGSCVPACPANETPVQNGCASQPVSGACPPPGTPVVNASNVIAYCLSPAPTTPTSQNEMTVTFSAASPHAYLLEVSGFVGTRSDGTCPDGTTFVPDITLRPSGAFPAITGPACSFSVAAEKKYLEATDIAITQTSACGGAESQIQQVREGTPCFFTVTALGMVVLKTGVDCTNGSEPATGTDAAPAGFPKGSTYVCKDSVLAVNHIPMSNVPIDITAENGFFTPTCYPANFFATPTPLPTMTETPNPRFPTRTPTAGATDTPTATPDLVLTPVCGQPGQSSIQTYTSSSTKPDAPVDVIYSAGVQPSAGAPGQSVTASGTFDVSGLPASDVEMSALFHFPSGDEFCSALTGPIGTASCTVTIPNTTPGTVNVDIYFIYNCTEFRTSARLTVTGGTPQPTPVPQAPTTIRATAPPGICVVRSGFGDLAVTASFASTVNTQPSITTGRVVLGSFTLATPVPSPTVATDTPIPSPTPPPSPTPTNTPVPTVTPSPPPSPTSTATSTPAPTPPPPPTRTPVVFRFTMDAARVNTSFATQGYPGIDEAHRGERVHFLMYYTIRSIPKNVRRTYKYELLHGKKVVYSYSGKNTQTAAAGAHRFVYFTDYVFAKNAAFGPYTMRITLTLDGKRAVRSWSFALTRAPTETP